ncbi:hypothetical protein [Pedobacter nanyangensis]|uniref:hypothetical protein n=1 Tax=Pedobacter nanyangensis TaxID=1562389 RepID=UPI000DE22C86|nr:hypothetical protein [Pedobacter nanyangensis]
MKKIYLSLSLLLLFSSAFAQNIFPKKYEDCNTSRFCLDCGDTKVTVDSTAFAVMFKEVTSKAYVNNLKGSIMVQVLVDSLGQSCVLSHTETKGHIVTDKIVMALNDFRGWKPAITKGKKEELVSINVLVTIKEGEISGRIERMTEEFINRLFGDRSKKN